MIARWVRRVALLLLLATLTNWLTHLAMGVNVA